LRHHPLRLLSALAVAAFAGVLAAPAQATVVRVDVINDAAPVVRIVNPADGASLVSGSPIVVRVEGENADALSMSVNGRATWSGAGDVLAVRWSPSPGTYRLVAVGERSGAPDAVASSTVEVVEPGNTLAELPAPGSPSPPASPGSPSPPASPGSPVAQHPAVPAPSAPAASGPVARRAASSASRAATPRRTVPPAAALAEPSAAPHHGSASPLMTLARAIGRLLSSPERVAWVLAFPLLLLIAGAGYVVLQRFIDGGPKLAWRGRGQSLDSVIEF
jgi:hypothetical protein